MYSFLYGATFISLPSVWLSVLCDSLLVDGSSINFNRPKFCRNTHFTSEVHILSVVCSLFKLFFNFYFLYRRSYTFSYLVCKKKITIYPTALGALTKSFLTYLNQICYATNQWRVKMLSHLLLPCNMETLQVHRQSFCILFYFCCVEVNELSNRSRDQLRLNVNPLFLC